MQEASLILPPKNGQLEHKCICAHNNEPCQNQANLCIGLFVKQAPYSIEFPFASYNS